MLRQEVALPCAQHGDPRLLSRRNYALMSFYEILARSHDIIQQQHGDQTVNVPRINMVALMLLCKSERLPFAMMFDRITYIHKGLYE